ncbi:molecular chaperone GrpE [Diaminobutyricimonas aerilata]|uniref:Protein GrpE n=2 Tax=Diaminobutyricimonas aerilata TaxID=1162967 RepID=A0A2M9CP35_9MICO|nr:molecular chaperone GrpE [Diaminobutyricimonas aerilata]
MNPEENEEPVVRDKRRIDPETGEVRPEAAASDAAAPGQPSAEQASEDGDTADVQSADDLIQAEGPDVELSTEDQQILDDAQRDLVAEMRNDMLRAQAELVNFRTRVERDRAANREAVIAEVIRSLLPAVDDLARAEQHGDLPEGSALALIAQKLRAGFEKYGLRQVGVKGEEFDPHFHEALAQLPSADVEKPIVADVIEIGYALGDRLIRAAKVAVSVPA